MQPILDEHDQIIMSNLVNGFIRSGILEESEDGIPVIGLEVGQTTTSLNENEESVEEYHRFARFTADKLSFFDENGVETAYISKRKLYINEARIIGNMERGDFMFDTSDGLALIPMDWEDEDE